MESASDNQSTECTRSHSLNTDFVSQNIMFTRRLGERNDILPVFHIYRFESCLTKSLYLPQVKVFNVQPLFVCVISPYDE